MFRKRANSCGVNDMSQIFHSWSSPTTLGRVYRQTILAEAEQHFPDVL
jgi:hypothetical protein